MGESPENIPVARAHDLSGAVLNDRYEVVGKLGVGGMAEVYEGRRIGLLKRVAIKVLKQELAEDEANVKRFLREARAASVIQHENIVEIVDFGAVENGPVYFVMEFLDGHDLRHVVKTQGRQTWTFIRPILLQIIDALGAAHGNGIVHRDVKPANVFLVPRADRSLFVKVLDFGIAKVVEEGRGITRGMTMTQGILGTVAYMAPEQAYGAGIDARTDIYALGVVMYELLTGRVPFKGGNPFTVLERHVNEAPAPPSTLEASIAPEVEALVLRCLAKDPGDRPQSMAELHGLVERLQPPEIRRTTGEFPVFDPAPGQADAPAWQPPASVATSHQVEPDKATSTEPLGSGGGRPKIATERTPDGVAPPNRGTERVPEATGTTAQGAALPGAARRPRRSAAAVVAGFGLGLLAAVALAFLAVGGWSMISDPEPDLASQPKPPAPKQGSGAEPSGPAQTPALEGPRPDPPGPPPANPDAEAPAPAGAEEQEPQTAAQPEASPPPATRRRGRRGRTGSVKPGPAAGKAASEPRTETPPRERKKWVHPDLKNPYDR